MIKKIIEYSVHNKAIIIALTIMLMLGGYLSLKNIPLDAIPDLSDTQVIIYSQWMRSPEIVENQVTYPIISGLLGMPKVKAVRGLTDYGLSYVYVIFEDNTDLYWARSRVLEFLNRVTPNLPKDVKLEIGPDATSVGWIYQYTLEDKTHTHSINELRNIQNFNLKYHLQSIPGVAEVAAIGGNSTELQVQVDPYKLQNYHLAFTDVLKTIRESNQESGAGTLEVSGTEYMIRSSGLIKNLDELRDTVIYRDLKTHSNIRVRDVAHVSFGPAARRGISDLNGTGDTVSGIIVMRQGEDTPRVIERVKAKLEELKTTLPIGIEIKTVYDRSDLISRALETLKHNLFEEMFIVSLVILIFLWHIPSAIVPIITIPISVLLAFIPLYLSGQSSNIMSLAGIAISIGVLVDGAIVEVENAYRKIQHWDENGRKENFLNVRLEALLEVGPSVFFSLLVIAVAFLPIFTLVDQEGKMFRPLAFSKNFAMAIAAFLSITLDPAVRMMFSRIDGFNFRSNFVNKILNNLLVGKYYSETKHPISKKLFKIYGPVVHFVLKNRKSTIIAAILLILSAIPGYIMLGSEFMPTLHEGSFLYMPTALPGLSLQEAQRILSEQGKIIKSVPEIDTVYGKAGRANTSTDTAPLSMIETTIQLKPIDQWRTKKVLGLFNRKITEDEIIDELDKKLAVPGMPNIWTMPIKNRIDMLSTGIRSSVGVKVFGPDLKTIENVSIDIEREVKKIKNVRTAVAERVAGGFFLDVDFDRESLANFGITMMDAQDQLMSQVGGIEVNSTLNGREHFPITVRLARDYRANIEEIKNIVLMNMNGQKVTLSQVAKTQYANGPAMIRNENGLPVGYVFVDVDTEKVDIGSIVDEMKSSIKSKVKIPEKYSITFSGQYENMIRVKERLKIVIPITLFIICFLLYLNTSSWIKTSIVLLAVPFSLVGAIWFMYLLGYHISIATWVGMIALMGLDAETGVFMLLYLDLSYDDHLKKGLLKTNQDLVEAIYEGAVHRLRPKLMTVCALFMGLIPIMWSTGAGADVMKRVAAPMIGGIVTSFLLELVIYPVIYFEWKKIKTKEVHPSLIE
jgi:Cu(I)/Ag(I) efflux system membrane protein CusA/SilA